MASLKCGSCRELSRRGEPCFALPQHARQKEKLDSVKEEKDAEEEKLQQQQEKVNEELPDVGRPIPPPPDLY